MTEEVTEHQILGKTVLYADIRPEQHDAEKQREDVHRTARETTSMGVDTDLSEDAGIECTAVASEYRAFTQTGVYVRDIRDTYIERLLDDLQSALSRLQGKDSPK